jgi:hypothetical protein
MYPWTSESRILSISAQSTISEELSPSILNTLGVEMTESLDRGGKRTKT